MILDRFAPRLYPILPQRARCAIGWHTVSFAHFATPGCIHCPRRWPA